MEDAGAACCAVDNGVEPTANGWGGPVAYNHLDESVVLRECAWSLKVMQASGAALDLAQGKATCKKISVNVL